MLGLTNATLLKNIEQGKVFIRQRQTCILHPKLKNVVVIPCGTFMTMTGLYVAVDA